MKNGVQHHSNNRFGKKGNLYDGHDRRPGDKRKSYLHRRHRRRYRADLRKRLD